MIGAGSLCSGPQALPHGVNRRYNVIQIDLAVVAASGYALFLPYQIFAMNNYIFVPLVLFVITTFLVVAHKQAKAQLPD